MNDTEQRATKNIITHLILLFLDLCELLFEGANAISPLALVSSKQFVHGSLLLQLGLQLHQLGLGGRLLAIGGHFLRIRGI